MVSTLRRVPFGRTQKEPKGPRPIVRPSLRSGSLAPVLLRGPAATGHPWPIAALPASMPVDPLHRTSSRPPGRAGRSKNTAPRGGRPAGLFGSRVLRNLCSRCRGTKAAIGDEVVAKSGNALCQLNQFLIVYDCCGAVAHQTDRRLRSSAAAIETLQLWERACSRRSFASRLAPTIGLDLQRNIYRDCQLTFFQDFSHKFVNCWGEGTTLIVGVRR